MHGSSQQYYQSDCKLTFAAISYKMIHLLRQIHIHKVDCKPTGHLCISMVMNSPVLLLMLLLWSAFRALADDYYVYANDSSHCKSRSAVLTEIVTLTHCKFSNVSVRMTGISQFDSIMCYINIAIMQTNRKFADVTHNC